MSTELFRAMQDERYSPPPPPPEPEIYLVVAHDGERWSVRRHTSDQEYRTIEAAQKGVKELSRIWQHARIYRIGG